jgi:hypothetical protein
MNSKTFARLMLFLPFCTFVESMGYFIFYDTSLESLSSLELINTFWNFFAIFWVIPYGILVIYLLIWSRKKTAEEMQGKFSAAAILLMFLACGIYLLLALVMFVLGEDSPYNMYGGGTSAFLVMALISVPASLGAGYAFVGFAYLILRLSKRVGFIHE